MVIKIKMVLKQLKEKRQNGLLSLYFGPNKKKRGSIGLKRGCSAENHWALLFGLWGRPKRNVQVFVRVWFHTFRIRFAV